MISAVTMNFGTAERRRSMAVSQGPEVERSAAMCARPREGGAPRSKAKNRLPASAGVSGAQWRLSLESFDVVPQRAILALVGRPDLLLRDFSEFIDLGLDHRHAERLELRLCPGEVVDR